VICAIEQAAKRGVNVRILVDARMARTYPETLKRLGKQTGIQVRKIDWYNKNGGIQHSKFFVVDHREVFIGSQNFDWRALDHIHEVGLRINQQEYARRMTELFNLDWQQSKGKPIPAQTPSSHEDWLTLQPEGPEPVLFLATASPETNIPSSLQPDLPQIFRLINQANKRVFIQLLTYSPSVRGGANFTLLEEAMMQAAKRGVDVRLLCSDWCTKSYEIPYLKKLVQLPGLQVKLSTIPEWSGGYLPFARVEHCKYMIADDSLSWVGSSNWEKSYFYNSRNVGVIVRNSQVNALLGKIFFKSWDGPYVWALNPQKEYKPKFYGEKH
jgi:phosphatidylserine/phosphatidylglycerophosphate/cardiolipin synthase-like enzyme